MGASLADFRPRRPASPQHPHVEPSFHFRLITADADDDKFADCAIAAEADFVITEDAHFRVLATAGYKPRPITPAEFIARFLIR